MLIKITASVYIHLQRIPNACECAVRSNLSFCRKVIYKILVIDSDEIFLELMKIKLERIFLCKVILAADFNSGCLKIKNESYNLIICEYLLDYSKTGIEIIAKSQKLLESIPIILIGNFDDNATSRQASFPGFYSRINKTNQFFINLIKTLIDLGIASRQ